MFFESRLCYKNLAIIGSGPSGISQVHHLIKQQELFPHIHLTWIQGENGIVLPKFQTWSNSFSKEDFFDLLRYKGFNLILDSAENIHITNDNNYRPLTDIFSVLEKLGIYLSQNIPREKQFQSSVNKITVLGNPDAKERPIQYALDDTRGKVQGLFDSVILATGASQRVSPVLEKYAKKLFLTQDLLQEGGIQKIFDALQQNPHFQISIVGASHSAFSVCHKFLIEAQRRKFPLQNGQIQIIAQSPIRLFYASPEEALQDGYSFHPEKDVCPVTKRVHRFGGVRVWAKKIAKTAMFAQQRNLPFPIKILYTNPSDASYHEALQSSAAVIQAFGEKPNIPSIVHENGVPFHYTGNVDPNTRQLIFENDRRLPGLHGVGFGYGINIPGLGEASYKGKIVFAGDYMREAISKEIGL